MSTTTEETLSSPVPFSPFSDTVSVSEPTSDEGPDLGQFNIVFRTLTDLHPHPWAHQFNPVHLTPDFTPVASSATEQGPDGTAGTETRIQEAQTQTSERRNDSTVWHQHPILSYLDYSPVAHTRTPSELIVAQYPHARFQGFMSTHEQEEPSQPVGGDDEDGEDSDGSDDTEGGLTVEISSNDGGELDSSIEEGSDEGEEEEEEGEINPVGDYYTEGVANGDITATADNMGGGARPIGEVPSLRQSTVIRMALRPYPHSWDSEEQENKGEFGPFDAATTVSSGTRPTEGSLYQPVYERPAMNSTPSSVRDVLEQDGAASILTSRTSPPLTPVNSMRSSSVSLPSFPAHDDNSYSAYYSSDINNNNSNISLPERPSSLPVAARSGRPHHVFFSPLNDNSTRSSISSFSSSSHSSVPSPPPPPPPPPQQQQLHPPHFRLSSPESYSSRGSADYLSHHQIPPNQRYQSAQPPNLFPLVNNNNNCDSHHSPRVQHRRIGSGSGSVSTITVTSDSTLTRSAGARTARTLRSVYTENTILGRREAFTVSVVPEQAVLLWQPENDNNNDRNNNRDASDGNEGRDDRDDEDEDIRVRDTHRDSQEEEEEEEEEYELLNKPLPRGPPHSPSVSITDSISSDKNFDSDSSPQPLPVSLDPHVNIMDARELYNSHRIPNIGYAWARSEDGEEPLPSLGLLHEALSFIAEERARWEASRDNNGAASGGLSSDSEKWKYELESSDSAQESNATNPSNANVAAAGMMVARSISTSTSTASASDQMLLSPPSQHTPRKKPKRQKKQKKTPVVTPPPIRVKVKKARSRSPSKRMSGNVTPIMMSILRPDGTIVGADGGAATAGRTTGRDKRRSIGSDGYLGSGTLTPRVRAQVEELVGLEVTPTKKKRGKEKLNLTLTHSRSEPQMKFSADEGPSDEDVFGSTGATPVKGKEKGKENGKTKSTTANVNAANAQTHTVNTKRSKLQGLVRQLQELFPEDKRNLDRVIKSLGGQKNGGNNGKRAVSGSNREDIAPGTEREGGEGEEEFDPRGRPPRSGDPLIHVFIDHSNILFGLLAHLKRHPPRRPLPPTPSSTSNTGSPNATDSCTNALSSSKDSNSISSPILPLPSFATVRTTQTQNFLTANEKDNEEVDVGTGASKLTDTAVDAASATRRRVRHLSHAALTLILERGRPVTRRALVTSSPLYQPIDGMERLGYQVSTLLRVPDLGDGMDRERYRDRQAKSSKRNSGSGYGSGSGSGSGPGIAVPKKRTHARHLSGPGNAFGGSNGAVSAPSSYPPASGMHLHNVMLAQSGVALPGGGGSGSGTPSIGASPSHRIRFREQGVDELLQLKLHQALAAEDEVPEGATIVLATGDGSVGQFNEEGFLGPVRTALKRGWKVELYSWEGGLSRAWKREFGEDCEWGKKGKFCVIGMEQFGSSLVEEEWISL